MNWQFLDSDAFKMSECLSCCDWSVSEPLCVSSMPAAFTLRRLLSSCGAPGAPLRWWHAGFSLQRPLRFRSRASRALGVDRCGPWVSRCGCRALEHRLGSCGARASSFHGTRDLPRPRIGLVSPTLAGGFSTAEPPGKPSNWLLTVLYILIVFLCWWQKFRFKHCCLLCPK